MRTTAIIITYNPPSEFFHNLKGLCVQFDQLIIVDNASNPPIGDLFWQQNEQNIKGNIEIITNEVNLGIASALNQGFVRSMEQGSDFVFVFDQDSRPAPNMIQTLLDTLDSHPDREKIAIVAPMVEDAVAGIDTRYLRPRGHFLFQRTGCRNQILEDVSTVITSGSLYNLMAYRELGPFRDDFFIDYVDTEYCLRSKQHGYKIVVNCNARLYHRLGNQQKRRMGPFIMRPTFHSPLRWYYIGRNRIPMFRLYAFRFPHWFLYELITNSYGIIRLLFFEDRKLNKLLAIILGTMDGLRQRMGPISNSEKALFTNNGQSDY